MIIIEIINIFIYPKSFSLSSFLNSLAFFLTLSLSHSFLLSLSLARSFSLFLSLDGMT